MAALPIYVGIYLTHRPTIINCNFALQIIIYWSVPDFIYILWKAVALDLSTEMPLQLSSVQSFGGEMIMKSLHSYEADWKHCRSYHGFKERNYFGRPMQDMVILFRKCRYIPNLVWRDSWSNPSFKKNMKTNIKETEVLPLKLETRDAVHLTVVLSLKPKQASQGGVLAPKTAAPPCSGGQAGGAHNYFGILGQDSHARSVE